MLFQTQCHKMLGYNFILQLTFKSVTYSFLTMRWWLPCFRFKMNLKHFKYYRVALHQHKQIPFVNCNAEIWKIFNLTTFTY